MTQAKNLDTALFSILRAQDWIEFVGQTSIKKSLQIAIKAARQRKESVDHVLFYGPPGLGKTTLASLIAKEMGTNLTVTSGTALAKTGDLAAILTNMKDGDVLFIDEIHRLPTAVEETLYPAMEDHALDIIIGKGPSARTVRLELPKFTLVGATTRYGLLSGPFRDRFGITHRLKFYKPEKLAEILVQVAKKIDIDLPKTTAVAIASRSRGTPRIALKLLKRVRDFGQVENLPHTKISVEMVTKALDLLLIDELGLDEDDRRLLTQIISNHNGGPVGVKTIAATIHEDSATIEDVIEPFLLQIGFLTRTPQGRVVTELAYKHLNIPYPNK